MNAPQLRKTLDNGIALGIKLTPAKLEEIQSDILLMNCTTEYRKVLQDRLNLLK